MLLAVQGGQHDDWDVGLCTDGFAHLVSVQLWQHQIQENQVRLAVGEPAQGFFPIGSQNDLVSFVLQIILQQFLDIEVVFHNKNTEHRTITSRPVYHKHVDFVWRWNQNGPFGNGWDRS